MAHCGILEKSTADETIRGKVRVTSRNEKKNFVGSGIILISQEQ
jgi:hypothetical protein